MMDTSFSLVIIIIVVIVININIAPDSLRHKRGNNNRQQNTAHSIFLKWAWNQCFRMYNMLWLCLLKKRKGNATLKISNSFWKWWPYVVTSFTTTWPTRWLPGKLCQKIVKTSQVAAALSFFGEVELVSRCLGPICLSNILEHVENCLSSSDFPASVAKVFLQSWTVSKLVVLTLLYTPQIRNNTAAAGHHNFSPLKIPLAPSEVCSKSRIYLVIICPPVSSNELAELKSTPDRTSSPTKRD